MSFENKDCITKNDTIIKGIILYVMKTNSWSPISYIFDKEFIRENERTLTLEKNRFKHNLLTYIIK